MAHEVETMMFAGETPWHGLGTYVGDEPVTSAEAIEKAGLDWNVATETMFHEVGGQMVEVPNAKCVRRDRDNSILGVVGTDYRPIQNVDAFSFLDTLVESGDVRYHTAGSLKGGAWTWALAQLPGGFEPVKGDVVLPYMFLITSHDGSLALSAYPTSVRVVCANTARAAMGERGGAGVTIRHTVNADVRLKQAQEVLRATHVRFAKFGERMTALAGRAMTDAEAEAFFAELVPASTEKVSTQIQNQRNALLDLFHGGVGQDITGVAGTRWAAFNAVTEWVNYHRTTRNGDAAIGGQDKRFEAAMLGTGNAVIERATALLMAA